MDDELLRGVTWHYAVKDDDGLPTKVLCWELDGVPEGATAAAATGKPEEVTCPACLSWMHA